MTMVLSALVSTVINKLADNAIQEVISVLGVESEMKNIHTNMYDIKSVLSDAESRKIKSESINLWLGELRDVMYDSEDLLDDFHSHADKDVAVRDTSIKQKLMNCRKYVFLKCLSNFKVKKKFAKRIQKIQSTLHRLDTKKSTLGLLQILPNADHNTVSGYNSSRMTDTTSLQLDSDIVGIDDDARDLVDQIIKDTNETHSIFAITGMGGIGKTTLARKVFNIVQKEKHFNKTIWVYVSRDCSGEYLLKVIVSSIDEDYNKTFVTLDQLSGKVSDVFSDTSVFIVLDDIWDSCLWEKYLKVPLLHKREKHTRILITTRNEDVANNMRLENNMGVVYMHRMERMLLEDGWLMLCKNVFNKEDKSDMIDQLEEIGKKIVQKCEYIPLAIKVVGGVLKMKDRTTFAWEKVRSSEMWLMKDLPEDIQASLLLSYEDLPLHLKQCFTFFSLFPKSEYIFMFQQLMVVNWWIAEGFIKKVEGKDLEESATDCYNELMMRNLLQTVLVTKYETGVTMHDLLHSLTLFLSKKEFIYIEHSDSIKLRHLSLFDKDLDEIPEKIMEQDYLRTLFLGQNPRLKTFSSDLLSHLRRLRVLDLSETGIETLPEEFGALIQLKLLNICYTRIKELPESIKNLKNLERLFAWGLKDLHSLPMGFTKLINLRLLQVDPVKNFNMPTGMDNMKELRHLQYFVVNKGTCTEGGSQPTTNIKELKDLSQLTRLYITNLERVASKEEAEEAAIEKKTSLEFLSLRCDYEEDQKFDYKDIEINEKVFAGLKVPLNLKELVISGFFGKELPSHISNANSLGQLTFLLLECCLFVKKLPCLGDLPELKRLTIFNAPLVKELNPEFFGSSKFPKLQFLKMKRMINLERMFEEEHEAFPCLVKLLISECPKLKSLKEGWQHAKCLKTLEVEKSGSLESIENFNSVSELKLLYNSRLTSVKNLPSLKIMEVLDCPALKEVKDVGKLNNMTVSAMDEEQITLPQWVRTMSLKRIYFLKKPRVGSDFTSGASSSSATVT